MSRRRSLIGAYGIGSNSVKEFNLIIGVNNEKGVELYNLLNEKLPWVFTDTDLSLIGVSVIINGEKMVYANRQSLQYNDASFDLYKAKQYYEWWVLDIDGKIDYYD